MRSTYAFATQNPRKRPVMGWLPLPVMGLVLVPVTRGDMPVRAWLPLP